MRCPGFRLVAARLDRYFQVIMSTIALQLQQVHARIEAACAAAHRPASAVTLLCVSKTHPAQAVRDAFAAGERSFGENYVQEGVDKIATLADLRSHIAWHLIGPLQSNKTRVVAEHFDWVHSVDRLKIAQRLSEQRPPHLPPLQICLQVNISGEESKSGLMPSELLDVATAVSQLPRLQLRGLMSIPEPADTEAAQRAPHQALRELFNELNQRGVVNQPGFALDTLSMGMTADMNAAILEGATVVRVGTAIFGARAASIL
jgi:PLP dependent protein